MSTRSATNHQKLDVQSLSFEERVQLGAENAIRCMGVTAQDRVFIITDYERESIAARVAAAALARHAAVTVHFLEHYGERPLKVFTDKLRNDLIQARPGHMIGIDENLMADGMCADYDEVFRLTNQVYELVRPAKKIHVTSAKGSDVTATFH